MKSFKEIIEGDVIPFPTKKKESSPANDEGPYTKDASHFKVWHDAHIKQNHGSSLKSVDAYEHYVEHADDHNKKYLTHDDFKKKMADKGYMAQHIAGSHRYIGIKLARNDVGD